MSVSLALENQERIKVSGLFHFLGEGGAICVRQPDPNQSPLPSPFPGISTNTRGGIRIRSVAEILTASLTGHTPDRINGAVRLNWKSESWTEKITNGYVPFISRKVGMDTTLVAVSVVSPCLLATAH